MLNERIGNFRPILRTIQIKSPLFFSYLIFFNGFLTQYAVWQLQKIIAFKNLENSYQDRQRSAKSRSLLFIFKEFQLFFAGALSQLIFLNVFPTQYVFWQLKKKVLSKNSKKIIRADKRALKAGIFSSNLKIFNCFLLVLRPNLFF
jgi:hypothetical protein